MRERDLYGTVFAGNQPDATGLRASTGFMVTGFAAYVNRKAIGFLSRRSPVFPAGDSGGK